MQEKNLNIDIKLIKNAKRKSAEALLRASADFENKGGGLAGDFLHDERLEDIAFLQVVEAFKTDTAFVA